VKATEEEKKDSAQNKKIKINKTANKTKTTSHSNSTLTNLLSEAVVDVNITPELNNLAAPLVAHFHD
jgi:hypothetical protein